MAGAEPILQNDAYISAARQVFGDDVIVEPSTVYVNVMGPGEFPFVAYRRFCFENVWGYNARFRSGAALPRNAMVRARIGPSRTPTLSRPSWRSPVSVRRSTMDWRLMKGS